MFATRDVEGARRLTQHDLGINERDRRCFDLAVRERTDGAAREVALMLAMMARAIERIGDNAVGIGRQAGFVAAGRLERSSTAAADGSPTGVEAGRAAATGSGTSTP